MLPCNTAYSNGALNIEDNNLALQYPGRYAEPNGQHGHGGVPRAHLPLPAGNACCLAAHTLVSCITLKC